MSNYLQLKTAAQPLRKHLWALLLLCSFSYAASAQTINASISSSPVCEHMPVSVSYTVTPGTTTLTTVNVFTVELSDDNFTSVTSIGNVTSSDLTGTIIPTLPLGVFGTGYQVRVTSSDFPAATSNSSSSFTITATPTVNPIAGQRVCNNGNIAAITFSGSASTYNWISSVNIGQGGTTGGGTGISSFTAINTGSSTIMATFTVTPVSGGCVGPTTTFTDTVDVLPAISITSNSPVCSGFNLDFTGSVTNSGSSSSPSPYSYVWTGPNSFNSAGNTPPAITATVTAAATNATGTYSLSVTDSHGCVGTNTLTATVNPQIVISLASNSPVCATNTLNPDSLTLAAIVSAGTYPYTFQWHGPASFSSPDSFAIVHSVTTAMAGIYTVTVTDVNSCTTTATDTAVVHPSAKLSSLPSGTLGNITTCNGATVPAVLFNSDQSGTVFSYHAVGTTSIYQPNAAYDYGITDTVTQSYFPNFIAVDTSDTVQTSQVIVFGTTIYGCTSDTTYNVSVNPRATMTPISDITICNRDSVDTIVLSGNNSAISFKWVVSNASAGLGIDSGTAIPSFIAQDTSRNTIIDTVTVIPSITIGGATCIDGSANTTFHITVYPTPRLSSLTTSSVCGNDSVFMYTPTTSTDSSVSYTWSRDTVSGISNDSTGGMGSISEILTDTTNFKRTATYKYVVQLNSSYGCSSDTTVQVTVYPKPRSTVVSRLDTICSGMTFRFTDTISTDPTLNTKYTWSRAASDSISNVATSGSDSVMEALINTSDSFRYVIYVDTLNIAPLGCKSIDTITVQVNPAPRILNLTDGIMSHHCDGDSVHFVPGSLTVNFTPDSFAWRRPAITGITSSQADSTGIDSIYHTLNNSRDTVVNVIYYTTTTVNGCIALDTLTDSVYPTPRFATLMKTRDTICSGTTFNNVPTIITPDYHLYWSRAAVTGINTSFNTSDQGQDSSKEILISDANIIVPAIVVYRDSLIAHGCPNNQYDTAIVAPTPHLVSHTDPIQICSDDPVEFMPTANVTYKPVSMNWVRPGVAGIISLNIVGGLSPADTIGIHDTLSSSYALTPKYVTYYYNLSYNATSSQQCRSDTTPSQKDTLHVTVNPRPAKPIVTSPDIPDSLSWICLGTMSQSYQITPASADTSIRYLWKAVNADLIQLDPSKATDTNKANYNCFVSFTNPGTVFITATAWVLTYGPNDPLSCLSDSIKIAHVKADTSSESHPVYYNDNIGGKSLECEYSSTSTTSADSVKYLWGYDIIKTLAPQPQIDQRNQIYILDNIDTTTNHYWVKTTTLNGCFQKSYCCTTGGGHKVPVSPDDAVKLYPNPASNMITVELDDKKTTGFTVVIYDVTGKVAGTAQSQSSTVQIPVNNLETGYYRVLCLVNGHKVASASFIKK